MTFSRKNKLFNKKEVKRNFVNIDRKKDINVFMANIRKKNKRKKDTNSNGRNRQDIISLINKLTKKREKK
jgi:hypothetical protein